MSIAIFKTLDKGIKKEIRKGLKKQRINASGNLSESLRSEITERSYKLFSADYVDYAERGRGPGKAPPLDSIYDWLKYGKAKYKKLNYKNDKERRSIAFAIIANIKKKGSYKHRNPSNQTNVVNDSIRIITEIVKKEFVTFVTEDELSKYKDTFKGWRLF